MTLIGSRMRLERNFPGNVEYKMESLKIDNIEDGCTIVSEVADGVSGRKARKRS